jgi:hypothetical protein
LKAKEDSTNEINHVAIKVAEILPNNAGQVEQILYMKHLIVVLIGVLE